MSKLQKHQPFSKVQFEYALRLSSPFGRFPEAWNYVHWKKNEKDGYRSEELQTPINEYCYIVPITFNPIRILKVYSSVDKSTDYSRDVGGDAIRIVLADDFGEPKHTAFKRINRIQNWEWNLRLRISEALSFLGFNTKCPECKGELFLRWNRKTKKRFLSCSMLPDCHESRNYPALNVALKKS